MFIPLEEGLCNIDVPAFPLCMKWADVQDAIGELGSQEHAYRTVIVDSLDWLEPVIWAHVCENARVSSIEEVGGGFGKGYVEAGAVWRDFLAGMDWLRAKGMTPILICHAEVRKVDQPDAAPYEMASLKLHKRSLALVQEWADVIGYAKHGVHVSESKGDFGKKTTKAMATGKRELCVDHHPAYVSGNRYGIRGTLPLDWAAFSAALTAARS